MNKTKGNNIAEIANTTPKNLQHSDSKGYSSNEKDQRADSQSKTMTSQKGESNSKAAQMPAVAGIKKGSKEAKAQSKKEALLLLKKEVITI